MNSLDFTSVFPPKCRVVKVSSESEMQCLMIHLTEKPIFLIADLERDSRHVCATYNRKRVKGRPVVIGFCLIGNMDTFSEMHGTDTNMCL